MTCDLPQLAWAAAVPGVYIFCGPSGRGQWEPYYIGITGDLPTRLRGHEKLESALALGATHVHILAECDSFQRWAIEYMLVSHHNPVLNVQLRSKRRGDTVPGGWLSDEAHEQIEQIQREVVEARQFMDEICGRRPLQERD